MNKLIFFVLLSCGLGLVLAHASTVTMVDSNDFLVTDDLNRSQEYSMSQINSYVAQAQSQLTTIGKQAQTADETYASWYGVQQQALNEISNNQS